MLSEVRFCNLPARVQRFDLGEMDEVLICSKTAGLCCTELQQSPGLTL